MPAAHLVAQSKKVSGTVRDDKGAPLSGASVMISGSAKGTTTDGAGKFSLDVSEGSTLVVSMSGHETQRISVRGKNNLDINLPLESASLNEVVVVGYGTQRKRDLTGAVRKINIEESPISTMTNISPLQSIQGTPGVNIGPVGVAGGAPSVLIRGQRSLAASNSPLIVLDGVIFGKPSHAVAAMEMGYDGVLVNTAVARATDPVQMARAFGLAVEAGRLAYLAGVMPVQDMAEPSTPVVGTPFWGHGPEASP